MGWKCHQTPPKSFAFCLVGNGFESPDSSFEKGESQRNLALWLKAFLSSSLHSIRGSLSFGTTPCLCWHAENGSMDWQAHFEQHWNLSHQLILMLKGSIRLTPQPQVFPGRSCHQRAHEHSPQLPNCFAAASPTVASFSMPDHHHANSQSPIVKTNFSTRHPSHC